MTQFPAPSGHSKYPLEVSPEVAYALGRGTPIVAFETTILSFGLPAPLNEDVGKLCEATARKHGATPATVAILDGRVRVGLDAAALQFFCSRDPSIVKVNLQNFAAVLASGQAGALTVAASMRACSMAGIRVFATGGIGGVHRGFEQTLDISSDLTALATYPVAVVCAGAKSILHIGATLEVLETLGVPVVGYQTQRFPLFFSRDSEYKLEIAFDSIDDIARFVQTHFACDGRGVLVVTPVPEAFAVDRQALDSWIESALVDAAQAGVTGKQVTPFLLERLEQLSDGRTLAANRALIENNASVAAQLAVALASRRASFHP